jgi:holo-[acyl-carrier protein] synthase
MLNAIGVDITDLARIRRLYAQHGERFLRRVFTAEEQQLCLRRKDPIPCLSVRFAAKEAVAKCLHLAPASGVRWRDIAVLHDQHGRPVLQLDGAAAALAGRRKIHISLSHSDAYAIAMAALEA